VNGFLRSCTEGVGLEVTQGTSFEGFSFGLHQGDSRSQLIVAAQGGDAAAFQELVHSYDAVVMRVALMLTGSEDSAQEIYFRVFRDAFASVAKLDFDTSVFVWLYRILVKHCIDYCRRNQGYFARSGSQSLAEFLRTLPPTERVVFLLKHSQGLKIRTVAEIFRCSPEHITRVLQNATISLRARLKPSFHQTA
jgi:RNA polymerase sigma-70 factor (ECF subfamily)